jgi:hypothetical protein
MGVFPGIQGFWQIYSQIVKKYIDYERALGYNRDNHADVVILFSGY